LDFSLLYQIIVNFMLTCGGHLGYNLKMQGLSPKGGTFYAENLSAQEAPQKKGARLPQADVRPERPQGSCPPQGKGQGASYLLIDCAFCLHGNGRKVLACGRANGAFFIDPALKGHLA
jgi:hypothetical protein